MKLPSLIEPQKNQRQIISFGGINKTDSARAGELLDCENLTSKNYPSLCSASKGRAIWETDAVSDIFWHKKGYLKIENNVLSFIRYIEKEKIACADLSWRETFTVLKALTTNYNNSVGVVLKEKIPRKLLSSYRGTEISFDGGETSYTVLNTQYDNNPIFYIEAEGLSLQKGDAVYTYTKNENSLSIKESYVTTNSSYARTLAINESLSEDEITKLRDRRFTLMFRGANDTAGKLREIGVVGGVNIEGVTYLTFDRDIARVGSGALLTPYELAPIGNDLTFSEEMESENTKTEFSENEYLLFCDTFARTTEEASEPILLSPGKKNICEVGRYICIFPDRVLYDTLSFRFSYMEEKCIIPPNEYDVTTETITADDGFDDYDFAVGDEVLISVLGNSQGKNVSDGTYAIIQGIEGKTLKFNSNTFAELSAANGSLMITREVPKLSVSCASCGRLFGADDEMIYVSKYNSPQNFKYFAQSSADSYYIEAITYGKFTACHPYSSYVMFFKENEIIKFYGDKPSEYQITSIKAPGVSLGSERSLCEVDGYLYYLAPDGVYRYSGGYPEKISAPLGSICLTGGIGGTDGRFYFLFAENEQGEQKTYIYDTQTGVWLSRDFGKVLRFLPFNQRNAYLSTKGLFELSGDEEDFFALFCPIFEDAFEKKKYGRFLIRAEVAASAFLKVEISEDGGDFYEIKTIYSKQQKTYVIVLPPNRVDNLSIRLSGRGRVKIISFVREFTAGGDER